MRRITLIFPVLVAVVGVGAWFLSGDTSEQASPDPAASVATDPGLRPREARASQRAVAQARPGRAPVETVRSGEARKRRDAARERIRSALQRRAADAPSHNGEPNEEPDEEPAGTLQAQYIQDTVREELVPLVRECYDALLERDAEAAGRVVMQFEIMGDESVGGIVDDVVLTDESELVEEDFGECVRESMSSVVFDPPDGGGTVTVTYPLVFKAA